MKKILVLNGPNINMLGIREKNVYGTATYDDLCEMIRKKAEELKIEVEIEQSNSEGQLVDWIQICHNKVDGIVINPGAYTHTSIAILDAVKAISLPTVEVHISRVDEREDFRRVSYIRAACLATISGHGTDGYLEAIDLLIEKQK